MGDVLAIALACPSLTRLNLKMKGAPHWTCIYPLLRLVGLTELSIIDTTYSRFTGGMDPIVPNPTDGIAELRHSLVSPSLIFMPRI